MKLIAKKDRLLLTDVLPLNESKSEKGFDVKNGEKASHNYGRIVSVPNSLNSEFQEGEFVILRNRAIPEEIVAPDGNTYSSYMSVDVLCGYEK